MNYCSIKEADCANGIGVRTVLFVSGCTHHCKGCFQPETWNFNYGKKYTKEVEDRILESLKKPYVDGLTLLGGEPMELINQEGTIGLIRETKKMGKNIWVYSGFLFDELNDINNKRCHGPYTDEILQLIDVLVDGEFHEEEKSILLKFRGSKNQRVIDVPATLREGNIKLLKMD
jgi:anaerobic ribonucleoside-triphosphate reductase activating protein